LRRLDLSPGNRRATRLGEGVRTEWKIVRRGTGGVEIDGQRAQDGE
jgi:hypothetical protein